MEERSFAKKAFAVAIEQLFMLITILSLFAADYFQKAGDKKPAIGLLGLSILGLIMVFVTIGYLTNAISSFHGLDKIGADIQFAVLVVIIALLMSLILPINGNYALADRMVVVGVVTYLMSSAFLLVYASFVTQIKDKILWKNCFLVRLSHLIMTSLFQHTMLARALRGLLAWAVGIAGTAIFFLQKRWWGLVLLAISIVIELYYSLNKAYEEKKIREAILKITEGDLNHHLEVEQFHGDQSQTAEAVNHIRDGLDKAVKSGIKNERMKADLITNVSHDLKTPLTSIINYVNILKEKIPETEDTWQYLAILDEKSQRLKTLLEDLLEVSRLTSGTVEYEINRIDFVELLYEIGGEYDDRFEKRGLTIVTKLPRLPILIDADGRQLCRAVENLYTNAAKYAKADTHVQVELKKKNDNAILTIRNIMEQPMTFDSEAGVDLTERFVRGDKSRTTEGSGLGLSITKEIVSQMGGQFQVQVEEDLYIASITFKIP